MVYVRGSRVILKRIVSFQTMKMWNELTGLNVRIIQRDSKRWTQFRKSVFQN